MIRDVLHRSNGKSVGEIAEQLLGFVPAQAGIGNGDAMLKGHPFFPGLLAWVEIAFQHESHDGLTAFAELSQDLTSNNALAGMIFL